MATALGVAKSGSTVAVIGVPTQPLAVGVIVNVTVTGDVVVLDNEPLISPLPLAAIPVTVPVLFLVQLNIVDKKDPWCYTCRNTRTPTYCLGSRSCQCIGYGFDGNRSSSGVVRSTNNLSWTTAL